MLSQTAIKEDEWQSQVKTYWSRFLAPEFLVRGCAGICTRCGGAEVPGR
jgi:hypothetical protein